MKFLKTFVLSVIGLLVLWVVVAQIYVPHKDLRADPKIVELTFVRTQGMAQLYALNNPNDQTPPKQIATQLQFVCDKLKQPICPVFVWRKVSDVAKGWPMTGQEDKTLYLNYLRNLNTNHEELTMQDDTGRTEEVIFDRSVPSSRH
ncbi:MAG: hypothetical protein PHD48_07610 [Alphaproteobacteria bacterium]|nr:hypothetical protein [Alphaproteobacteria bacterium]